MFYLSILPKDKHYTFQNQAYLCGIGLISGFFFNNVLYLIILVMIQKFSKSIVCFVFALKFKTKLSGKNFCKWKFELKETTFLQVRMSRI